MSIDKQDLRAFDWIPKKIISGGQTGVDRAALDWAMASGIAHGGWCPSGRKAEDGIIPAHYSLSKTESTDYARRTTWNVRDSDATLILNMSSLDGGTLKTSQLANKMGKPSLVVQLDALNDQHAATVWDWIKRGQFAVLNVAGPRESKRPGIYTAARRFLETSGSRRSGIRA